MTAIELQRNNVTVAEFFSAIKAACKKKGMSFDLDRENFENPHGLSDDTYTVRDGIKYARYGKGEPTREYDGSDAGAKAETYRVKPYDYQCYILNHDGSMWNESCEFTFDDEKRGHGYYYQASKEATDTPNEKTITKDQAHYNFYKQYSELDLGWLEPIRDIIDQYALDNSSDSKPENMAEVAINTAIGYRDQPEYAWELFGKELERVGVKR